MGKLTILALRVVIALCLAGSLFVQVVMVPLLWVDLEGAEAMWVRTSLIVIIVLGIVTMQVSAVCIWQLLSLVRAGSVFSNAAFRYVDVVFGAVATASALTFILAVILAPGDVAPGVVGLICGLSLGDRRGGIGRARAADAADAGGGARCRGRTAAQRTR